MLTRKEFYFEWSRRALSGPLGWAQGIQMLLTFVLGFLSAWKPNVVGDLTPLLWIVPLIVFIVTLVVVWTLAPYAMYRELETSTASAITSLSTSKDQELAQILAERDSANQNLSAARGGPSLADVREKLRCLAEDAREKSCQTTIPRDDVIKFVQEAKDYIKNTLRDSHYRDFCHQCPTVYHQEHRGYLEENLLACRELLLQKADVIVEHDINDDCLPC